MGRIKTAGKKDQRNIDVQQHCSKVGVL